MRENVSEAIGDRSIKITAYRFRENFDGGVPYSIAMHGDSSSGIRS